VSHQLLLITNYLPHLTIVNFQIMFLIFLVQMLVGGAVLEEGEWS
jgi:hypothetical protein